MNPDPLTLSTVIRDGNFDYLTNSVHWHNTPAGFTIPNSMYLSSKPAFFGTYTWPWVDATGATKLYVLPAKARYDAGTPFAPPPGGPPVAVSAVSRKVHGAAGTFDLPLTMVATNPTTEPRQSSSATIVMTFDAVVVSADATITEGTATAGAPTFNGNDVIVPLTGVADQHYVTVLLTNVASATMAGGSGSVRIGFLVGDVNQSRTVSLGDLGLVNSQLAQPVTGTNFLKDLTVNGTLTLADKATANASLTHALPAP